MNQHLPASEPDELPGFQKSTLHLPAEDDGELCATLVYSERTAARPERSEAGPTPTVLYLHGFVDYFFHTHVADAFEAAGARFFALDLRRHGRSLRQGNRPCFARRIDDFFAELDWAIESVVGDGQLVIVAHSTGALMASLYAVRGQRRNQVRGLVLNSPFFRFPLRTPVLRLKLALGRRLGRVVPTMIVPQELSAVYGMTLHASQHGEWNYDLAKKPLRGFAFYAGWSTMITSAQDEVARGLGLSIPIFVLHSARSHVTSRLPEPEDFRSDTVLLVEDMVELAPRLGRNVTRVPISGGLHDLALSAPEVRATAIHHMVEFALRAASMNDAHEAS